MKPSRLQIFSHTTNRDSLTEAWRRGKITTREFHHQWVAMAVRSTARKPQPSTAPQP